MFQTSVLASGSKGNCILVTTDHTSILFDAGLSGKRIWDALHKISFPRDRLNAIVISHEHNDHITGAGVISRALKIPVYITPKTYTMGRGKLGQLYDKLVHFEPGKSFFINDLTIHPFISSHDAIDSCNFTVLQSNNNAVKLAIATDVGYSSKLLETNLQNSTTLILESNHDEKMLIDGPYDWALKQRIRSMQGHLSNVQAIGVLNQVYHSQLKNLILAHLSEVNNTPELVNTAFHTYLHQIHSDIKVFIADQYEPTPLIDI